MKSGSKPSLKERLAIGFGGPAVRVGSSESSGASNKQRSHDSQHSISSPQEGHISLSKTSTMRSCPKTLSEWCAVDEGEFFVGVSQCCIQEAFVIPVVAHTNNMTQFSSCGSSLLHLIQSPQLWCQLQRHFRHHPLRCKSLLECSHRMLQSERCSKALVSSVFPTSFQSGSGGSHCSALLAQMLRCKVEEEKEATLLMRSDGAETALLAQWIRLERANVIYVRWVVRECVEMLTQMTQCFDWGDDAPHVLREGNEINAKNLAKSMLQRFCSSEGVALMSTQLRDVCKAVYEASEEKFPGWGVSALTGFFFLRILGPSIIFPGQVGLTPVDCTPRQRKVLISFAKMVQQAAMDSEEVKSTLKVLGTTSTTVIPKSTSVTSLSTMAVVDDDSYTTDASTDGEGRSSSSKTLLPNASSSSTKKTRSSADNDRPHEPQYRKSDFGVLCQVLQQAAPAMLEAMGMKEEEYADMTDDKANMSEDAAFCRFLYRFAHVKASTSDSQEDDESSSSGTRSSSSRKSNKK